MTTLFDSKPRVKPARKPFGVGLNRRFTGPTAEEAAWAAYEMNKDCQDYEVVTTDGEQDYDRLAEESENMDRYFRGIIFC